MRGQAQGHAGKNILGYRNDNLCLPQVQESKKGKMVKPTFVITKVWETKSRHTGKPVYMVTFKGDDTKSYRCWIDPLNGNYKRWANYLTPGIELTNLKIKAGNLIDADSRPEVVLPQKEAVTTELPPSEQYLEEEPSWNG